MSSRWRALALVLALAAVVPLSLGADGAGVTRDGAVTAASDQTASAPVVIGRLNAPSRSVLAAARALRPSGAVRLDTQVVALLVALVVAAAGAIRARDDRTRVVDAALVASTTISHRGPPSVV